MEINYESEINFINNEINDITPNSEVRATFCVAHALTLIAVELMLARKDREVK